MPPSTQSNSWDVQGQERYPLNIVTTVDGGVENPVFEANEDTPMDSAGAEESEPTG